LRHIVFALYRILVTLALPFAAVYVLLRAVREPAYARGLGERFGFLDFRSTVPGGIWLHAVSVGEVLSAGPLITELERLFPGRPIYLSTSTTAGRAMAEERLSSRVARIFYTPIDAVWIVRRVLRQLRPAMLIVLETEIWPNLWNEAKRFGASLYVLNARISDKAWPSYRTWRWFFAPVLALPRAIFAQSRIDENRYRELGRVDAEDAGNLKYDFPLPKPCPPEIAAWAGAAPLWIAASTMAPNEEEFILEAFQELPREWKLLIAPRHLHRCGEVAQRLEAARIDYVRRTQLDRDARVLLLDTMGELASCFALPSVVFVGGSLVNWGGHNLLEPALFARPIVAGPHFQNFQAMFDEFREAGALAVVHSAKELASAVRQPRVGGAIGQRLAHRHRGVAASLVARLELGAPLTHPVLKPLLWPLSRIWLAGVAVDRAFTRPRRLAKPVVSIGGLAMGGVGKTPFALWLIERLHQRGWKVGILTRGYQRRDPSLRSYAPGESAPLDHTGDEAQLYLRQGIAYVGVGADRFATAQQLEASVDVFLLDDGFQHWPLQRDLDLVLLDPLDPNAGGGVFPLGRLREPPSALQRADRVLSVTKTIANPPPPGRYSAFCGIGNPSSFRHALLVAGVSVAEFREFPDHHRYTVTDLSSLAPPRVTTAKDAVNLPDGIEALALGIRLQVPDEQELIAQVEQTIRRFQRR
jgi:3-deoxy-D-manno-octulosonic-acid transferase